MTSYCLRLALAALSAAFVSTAIAAEPSVALKAAHLFDSVSGKLVDHGVVVVSGKKIQAVGAAVQIPAGAQIIELGDATSGARDSSMRTCI